MSTPVLRREFILGAAAAATGCADAPGHVAQPESADWARAEPPNSNAAPTLAQLLSRLDTTSLMAVHRGRVIASYGDEQLISYLASARKSLVSMILGASVARGVIDLDALDLVVTHKTQAPSKLNVAPQQYLDEILPAAMRLVR